MRAIHITHTVPFFARNSNTEKAYSIPDFELLSTILSALKWQEHNGSIRLYTDKQGFEYYRTQNMISIWDLGINTETLDNITKNIDFETFWAAGKLFALRHEISPCFMIDTDFIVWKNISTFIENKNDIICIHKEELFEGVYLPKEFLKTAKNYQFDETWSWNVKPCNAGFVYFGNREFKHYYTGEAIRFMKDNFEKPLENVSQMVFAEQRLMAMCADKQNIKIKTFIKSNNLSEQDVFTHVWGYKQVLKDNSAEREKFCKKIAYRLINDYPEKSSFLMKIPVIKRYIDDNK